MMADVSIALNRFGLGARPDDLPAGDSRRWLMSQLDVFEPRPAPIAALPGRRQIAGELAADIEQMRVLRQEMRQALGPPRPAVPAAMGGYKAASAMLADAPADTNAVQEARRIARRRAQDLYLDAVGARVSTALLSPTPFVERLVHFWANHFAVSTEKASLPSLAGLFEFEAVRPHVLGTFGAMISAVERHPAMLLYLDQAQSVAPASPAGARLTRRGGRIRGANENLAREIMELHTLGVRTGYVQADVTEFAQAMTGWTVVGLSGGAAGRFADGRGSPGDFLFAPPLHEPGTRTIMGRHYPQPGESQAQAVLDDLAVSPATATHIATKLARHFVGDSPPSAMVGRMQAAFLKTGGDLPSLYRALIDSPEAWVAEPAKFKTPWEWSISAMRALGMRTVQPSTVNGLLNQLGQRTWQPGSPAGYDDIAASWAGPDAIMRRVEAAQRFAAQAGEQVDARTLAPKLFPATLSSATAQALARAESGRQALALLLVAPEFMRR